MKSQPTPFFAGLLLAAATIMMAAPPTHAQGTTANVSVSNGLFVAQIDFGQLSGQAYWLDIGVRAGGSANPFTILSPRPQLTPAPYAIFAGHAGSYEGAVADSQLSP